MAQFDWSMIGALLYLGVCGTALAFVWYYMSVKKLGTAVTSIFNNLVPVFGVADQRAAAGRASAHVDADRRGDCDRGRDDGVEALSGAGHQKS